MSPKNAPDVDHLKWAIDRRAEILHTLLALYKIATAKNPMHHPILLDHLIAGAFSLWRAVFLAETNRDWASRTKGQADFLKKVVGDNSISYADDKSTRAWTVGHYLENAKVRLIAAYPLSSANRDGRKIRDSLWAQGTFTHTTRLEWEAVHIELRKLLNALPSIHKLPIPTPSGPVAAPFPATSNSGAGYK
jgi:hypothetical protein